VIMLCKCDKEVFLHSDKSVHATFTLPQPTNDVQQNTDRIAGNGGRGGGFFALRLHTHGSIS
jgi:hypothetical protein